MAFVDLSQAFETVEEETLWDALHRFGCPNKFVNIFRQFHDGMTARVTIGGQESAPSPVHIGIRQGCMLAPVLFNIFLLCVTELLHNEIEKAAVCQWTSGSTATSSISGSKKHPLNCFERGLELRDADDCVLVSHTPQDSQSVLDVAVRMNSRMGLTVNTTKTEVVYQ